MNTRRHSEAKSGREAGRKMVKASVEVRSGVACFRVGVQAESIRGALGMVGPEQTQREAA
jgi:hypothetical protein